MATTYHSTVSLSASDYSDFTRIMALYKLYYLIAYLLTYIWPKWSQVALGLTGFSLVLLEFYFALFSYSYVV